MEIKSGRWELIRLTPLREGHIIRSKHAAAQLRQWGLILSLISIRVALVVLLFFVTLLPYADSSNLRFTAYLSDEPTTLTVIEFVFLSLQSAGLFVLGIVFLLEPIWRVRGMTALGLAISARVYDGGMATMVSAAAIISLWGIQLIILIGVFSVTVSFSFFMLYSPVASGFIYILIFAIIVCLAQIGVFYLLQTWALRRVAWQLVRLSQ
jgi:magnesium-transporting ATPase (P-type)